MKQVQINKVPIEPLIELLIQIQESGIEFVDIVLKQGEDNQDTLGILVREEYIDIGNNDNNIDINQTIGL